MRVAFTLARGSDLWTGGFNYLRNVFRALRIIDGPSISPLLFVGPSPGPSDRAELARYLDEPPHDAPWLELGQRGRRLRRAILTGTDPQARRDFRRADVDVVFEWSGEYYGWRFPLAKVVWIPDFQSHRFPDVWRRRDRWRIRVGRRLQVTGADLILLSSRTAERDCLDLYPSAEGRTAVVPFAVTPVDEQSIDRAVLTRYSLPEGFIYLPNQFWMHKNHGVVVDALQLIQADYPDLVVVSSGSPQGLRGDAHHRQLVDRVRQLGLAESFRFLGMIPASDVASLLGLSRALLNPSWFEGWSTTVEEAKAIGTPLCLSDIAVHREQAGGAAVFFDPGDPADVARALVEVWSVADVVDASGRRVAAREQARQRTREFGRAFAGAMLRAHRSG